MYGKLPPEDEWLIYSKYVEDIYWNKFEKKVHLDGSYYADDMLVFQPTLFILVYIREEMQLSDAVFPFFQVKYETDIKSSAANILSGRLRNGLKLRSHKK